MRHCPKTSIKKPCFIVKSRTSCPNRTCKKMHVLTTYNGTIWQHLSGRNQDSKWHVVVVFIWIVRVSNTSKNVSLHSSFMSNNSPLKLSPNLGESVKLSPTIGESLRLSSNPWLSPNLGDPPTNTALSKWATLLEKNMKCGCKQWMIFVTFDFLGTKLGHRFISHPSNQGHFHGLGSRIIMDTGRDTLLCVAVV